MPQRSDCSRCKRVLPATPPGFIRAPAFFDPEEVCRDCWRSRVATTDEQITKEVIVAVEEIRKTGVTDVSQ